MTVAEFNKKHKVGATIKYRNEQGEIVEAKTRWTAEELEESKTPVIWVEGECNAVELKNIIV